jgi:hypothetical protein
LILHAELDAAHEFYRPLGFIAAKAEVAQQVHRIYRTINSSFSSFYVSFAHHPSFHPRERRVR